MRQDKTFSLARSSGGKKREGGRGLDGRERKKKRWKINSEMGVGIKRDKRGIMNYILGLFGSFGEE